jgi:hypothetical protein
VTPSIEIRVWGGWEDFLSSIIEVVGGDRRTDGRGTATSRRRWMGAEQKTTRKKLMKTCPA